MMQSLVERFPPVDLAGQSSNVGADHKYVNSSRVELPDGFSVVNFRAVPSDIFLNVNRIFRFWDGFTDNRFI